MKRDVEARLRRDAPYLDDYARSVRDQRRPVSGFASLLRWFTDGFAAETPERMHVRGVWFGRPDDALDPVLGGGSQLGAPKQAEPFRQLLENAPTQVVTRDGDERYARPMRAALARLARNRDGDAPFMARYLTQVGYAQGDWQAVADRWFATTPFVAFSFTQHALERLHRCYRAEPPNRYLPSPERRTSVDGPGWVSMSESQRHAIEAGEQGAE